MINAIVAIALWAFALLAYWIVVGVREYLKTRRWRAVERRHDWRSVVMLEPGERVIPLVQVGGPRKPHVSARGTCGHWPRDEVTLSDGATVAYICRRCNHDWADEQWVMTP